MNPREFTKKWIEGMKNLSPENQVKAQISGAIGNLIGFLGGIITMTYFAIGLEQYQWWWTILILIIAFWITIIDLIAKKQQLKSIQGFSVQMKALQSASLGVKQ